MSTGPTPSTAAVWVLGSVNLDRFEWQDERTAVVLGGMALTAWRVLTALGRPARLVSAVGADPEGDEVLSRMRREGIGADHVVRVPGSPTGRAVYRLDPDGARLLELRLHAGLGARRLATIRRSGDAVLLMGASLRDVSAVAAARPLFWNPGQAVLAEGQGRFPWPAADVLFVNRREWQTYRHHGGPRCAFTVVTHHGHGAALLADGEEVAYHRPAYRFEGLDVGAGDAFAAAFTHALLLGRPPAESLGFAGEQALRFLRERDLR